LRLKREIKRVLNFTKKFKKTISRL